MKKRNIILGFISSLTLLLSYIVGKYMLFAEEYYWKNIKYMNLIYKMQYVAIIPIILLIAYFLIVLLKKKNTSLTKVLLIAVAIINSIICILSRGGLISIIFNILLLVYLIKVWFMPKIPLDNKAIIIAFVLMILASVFTNIYNIINIIQRTELWDKSFITAIFSSVLSQIAYIMIAFYYNDLYSECDNRKMKVGE
ncbi:MAG: hypothetical protein E7313_02025 [Clostridiales bacterium]|nr:hypothetical protein [Clostridiales bacterium]